MSERRELLHLQMGIRLASQLGREMLALLSVVTSGLCEMPGTAIEELPPTIPPQKHGTAASEFLSELTEVGPPAKSETFGKMLLVSRTEATFHNPVRCSDR